MFGLLASVAPTLGKAIQGDFGGAVNEALKAFGIEGGTKSDLEKAMDNANPEQLARLKEIDNAYKVKMEELGVDLEKIASQDRDSARTMRIETGSLIGDVVGCGIVLGFFWVMFFMFTHPESNNRALDIMLGSLGTMTTAVINFHFGSSSGSRMKDKQMRGSVA